MFPKHIVAIVILTGVLVKYSIMSRGFFSCKKDICYYVRHHIKDQLLFTTNITNSTRIIINDDFLNYYTYYGSKVKVLQNSDYIIFYNCPDHKSVSYFLRFNFSSLPSRRNKRVDKSYGQVVMFTANAIFQKCLEHYCDLFHLDRLMAWKFQCENNNMNSLNLKLTRTVTNFCLESIKYAVLNSSSVYDLNTSLFFKYAVNLIMLTIIIPESSKAFKCDLFRDIVDLRLLRLPKVDLASTYCIFQYNPQLVRISNSSARLWNMCNGTFDLVDDIESKNLTITNNTITNTDSDLWEILFLIFDICIVLGAFFLILRHEFYKQSARIITTYVETRALEF